MLRDEAGTIDGKPAWIAVAHVPNASPLGLSTKDSYEVQRKGGARILEEATKSEPINVWILIAGGVMIAVAMMLLMRTRRQEKPAEAHPAQPALSSSS